VQRHLRPLLGKTAIDLDDDLGPRVLQRDAIAREAQLVEQFAVFQRAGQHRRKPVVARVARQLGRVYRAAVDADPKRAVMSGSKVGQVADLVLPGPLRLVVMKMAGVVSQLVYPRGDLFRQAVVLLQINRQVGPRATADLGQGGGIAGRVYGDADHRCAGGGQLVHRGDSRLDVARPCRAHALYGDRLSATDHDRADANGPRRIPREGPVRRCERHGIHFA